MILEHADVVSEIVSQVEEDKQKAMDELLHNLAEERNAKKTELMR